MIRGLFCLLLTGLFVVALNSVDVEVFNSAKREPAAVTYFHSFNPRPPLITRVTEATQRWPFFTEGVSENPRYPCGSAIECSRKSRRRTETLRSELDNFQKNFDKSNVSDEILADLTNFFVSQWCDRGITHSVCGNDPYNTSKIFKLDSYGEGGRGGSSGLYQDEGAIGLLLLASNGQYLRIYLNSRARGASFGEGDTGVFYRDGRGLNSIQNMAIGIRGAVYRTGEPITDDNIGQLYIHWTDKDTNAHIFWWEHFEVTYSDNVLKIAMPRDSYEEKWAEAKIEELSFAEQRTLSSTGPGFGTLW